MAFIAVGSNPKPSFYECVDDNDLVVTPVTYGSLTSLVPQGFGPGTKGYILGPSDEALNLPPCTIYSRAGDGLGGGGRIFVITQGTTSKCLVLVAEGSPSSNVTPSSGADILLVVGKAAKYSPLTFSSAVYASITLAAAAANALATPGATILVLDDAYNESFTLNDGTNVVGFASKTGGSVNITGTATLAAGATVTLRNLSVNGGAGAAVAEAGAATLNAFDCTFAGTTPCVSVTDVNLSDCTVVNGTDAAVLTSDSCTYTNAIIPDVFVSFNDNVVGNATCTAAVTARSSRFTANLAGTVLSLRDTRVGGTTGGTAGTLNNCVFAGTSTFSSNVDGESCTFTDLTVTGTSDLSGCRASGDLVATGVSLLTGGIYAGTATFGSSFTANGTIFFGNVSISAGAGAGTMRSCQLGSAYTHSGTGATTMQNTNVEGAVSVNAATISGSFIGAAATADGLVVAFNTVFNNSATFTTAATQAFNCTFRTTSSFFHAQTVSQCSFLSNVTVNNNSAAPLTHLFQGCYFVTGAGTAIATTTADDLVQVAGGYSNAANNQLTSGIGSTQFLGHVAGGNRAFTDNTVQSVSDMRVLSNFTITMAANSSIQGSIGATNPMRDFFIVTPTVVAPVLTTYPGTQLPDGFEFHIRNASATESFSLAPAGTDTFDAAATTLIGPGDIRHYTYVREDATVTIYEIV